MKKSDGLIRSLMIAVTMLLIFIVFACGESTSDSGNRVSKILTSLQN